MDSATIGTQMKALLADYRQAEPDFPEVQVLDASIRQEGRWWYVPIVRDGMRTMRAHPYYDHLNEIEARARQQLGVDILLVPARAA